MVDQDWGEAGEVRWRAAAYGCMGFTFGGDGNVLKLLSGDGYIK